MGPGRPSATTTPIDRDGTDDLPHGRREEDLGRGQHVVQRPAPLLHGVAVVPAQPQQMRSGHAGQDAEAQPGGPDAVPGRPPDVARRPLEHGAIGCQQQRVVRIATAGFGECCDVHCVARRLDATQQPR